MFKALAALVIAAALVAGGSGMGTAAHFAERAAEYEATKDGIAVVDHARSIAPDDQHLERTYVALTKHCTNLAALYNVGSTFAADELADARLPESLDAAACN